MHLDKKTGHHKQTINYLGRYLKRPPIAGSRLQHYAGGSHLSFDYLDHNTKTYKTESLSQKDFIQRLIQHIPEKHFRMVRYFGFLANRVCGKMHPKVYVAPGQTVEAAVKITHWMLSKAWLNLDPYACLLCGSPMVFTRGIRGLNRAEKCDNVIDIARMRCVL